MYNLAIIQNGNIRSLFGYDNLDDALSKFHEELAYRGEERTSTFCLIFDENGNIYANEVWHRKTIEELEPVYKGEETEAK